MPKPSAVKENRTRGLLFALIVPVIGTAAWVLLWQFGFIASVVAWLIAALAIKFYRYGAGTVSRSSLPIVLGVIIFGVVAAFVGGMASDALAELNQEPTLPALQVLTSLDFWAVFGANLLRPELWASYGMDIAIVLAFAGLGAYGTVRELLMEVKKPAGSKAKTATTA